MRQVKKYKTVEVQLENYSEQIVAIELRIAVPGAGTAASGLDMRLPDEFIFGESHVEKIAYGYDLHDMMLVNPSLSDELMRTRVKIATDELKLAFVKCLTRQIPKAEVNVKEHEFDHAIAAALNYIHATAEHGETVLLTQNMMRKKLKIKLQLLVCGATVS
jgi:hypothetical protein